MPPWLLVAGGAGFILCDVVHRWLSTDDGHTAVPGAPELVAERY